MSCNYLLLSADELISFLNNMVSELVNSVCVSTYAYCIAGWLAKK